MRDGAILPEAYSLSVSAIRNCEFIRESLSVVHLCVNMLNVCLEIKQAHCKKCFFFLLKVKQQSTFYMKMLFRYFYLKISHLIKCYTVSTPDASVAVRLNQRLLWPKRHA